MRYEIGRIIPLIFLQILLLEATPSYAIYSDTLSRATYYGADGLSTHGEEYFFDDMPPIVCEEKCWKPFSDQGTVGVAPCYSVSMLSRLHYRPIKQLVMLSYFKCMEHRPDLIISAELRASLFFAHTNFKDKFGYLGRFPGSFVGRSASVADINDHTFAITYSPLSWVHGYWEFLSADRIVFTTDPRQGTNQTQKVYALIGDLDKSPFYMTIGKKDVSFGQMYTVNPFSPSMTWHYFGALSDGLAVGYARENIYFEATVLNGGRGIRVVDSNTISHLNNGAINASYAFNLFDCCWKFGAGYLFGTIYDGTIPEHTGPVQKGPRNGVWDLNFELRCMGWRGYFEACGTEHIWPSGGHSVQTFSGGISYCVEESWFYKQLVTSLEYSEGIQGKSYEEWRHNFQFVAGLDWIIRYNVHFSIEYIVAGGFAPLIDLAVPGVSRKCERENIVQFGISINI